MTPDQITLSNHTIHNPAEARHFMRVKPVGRTIIIRKNGSLIARTDRALRIIEAGRDIYDPVIYLPFDDLSTELTLVKDKTTHCPLKGNAVYFTNDAGEEIAWSYRETLDFADELKDLVAFYPDLVSIEEIGKADSYS